jgi:hypothetical protein
MTHLQPSLSAGISPLRTIAYALPRERLSSWATSGTVYTARRMSLTVVVLSSLSIKSVVDEELNWSVMAMASFSNGVDSGWWISLRRQGLSGRALVPVSSKLFRLTLVPGCGCLRLSS